MRASVVTAGLWKRLRQVANCQLGWSQVTTAATLADHGFLSLRVFEHKLGIDLVKSLAFIALDRVEVWLARELAYNRRRVGLPAGLVLGYCRP